MFTRYNHPILRVLLAAIFGMVFTVIFRSFLGNAGIGVFARLANTPTSPTGIIDTIATGQIHGLSLASGKLFLNRSCGGELYIGRTWVTAIPTSNFASGSSLFQNDTVCGRTATNPGHVLSINVAADDTYAYWLTRNGNIVRNRHNGTPLTIPETIRSMVGTNPLSDPPAYSIAVNVTMIVWNEGRQLYSTPKSIGGAVTLLGSATNSPRKLHLTNQAPPRLLYLDGANLMSMAQTSLHPTTLIATNVSDYYVDGVDIYFGQNAGTSYQILSANLNDHTIIHSPYYTSPLDPSLRVSNLAVGGGRLYWFERQGSFGGQIYMLTLPSGSRSAQTDSLRNLVSMVADTNSLYWLSQNSPYIGAYRLTPGSAVDVVPGDMSVTGITVTQGIQVGDNQIPLVGWKPTVVRVFVASTPGNHGPWQNVRARLDVEGSSVSHYAVLSELPAASNQRILTSTFNFALSDVETLETLGILRHITATLFSMSGRREDNRSNNTLSSPILFTEHRELRLPTFQYSNLNMDPVLCSTDHADGYITPWNNIISHTIDARDVLPLHLVSLYPATGMGTPPIDDSDCRAYIRAVEQMKGWMDRAYASGGQIGLVMQPDSGHPGGTCWSTSRRNSVINIQDVYRDHALAHEISHAYPGVYAGRHTWNADAHYPRPTAPGETAEWMGNFIGLQTFGGTRLIIGSADPSIPTHNVWDLMSYGVPNWPSPYTYCKDLKYMSGNTICCPDSVEGGCSSPDRPDYNLDENVNASYENSETQKPGIQQLPNRPQDNLPYLYVSGWISPTNEVGLNPFEIINSSKDITTISSGGAYSVKLMDSAANTLHKFTFDALPQHSDNFDNPAPTPMPYSFSAYLPWNSNTVTITLEYKGAILAQRTVSAHAPLNVVQAFSPSQPVTGTHDLTWIASDTDFDPLVFSIWYSPDNGSIWLPIAVSNTDPNQKLNINFNLLPGSNDGEGILRVLASDGVLTTESRTETAFTVAHKPPTLTLIPTFGADGYVSLIQANAIDPEDLVISDPTRFAWSSNWDGALGDGLIFNRVRLSPGEHVLTATVTDYDSMQASATITVNVPGYFESGGLMAQPGLLGALYFDASLPMTLTVPPGAVKEPVRFRASLPLDTSFDPPGAIGPSFVFTAALSSGAPVQSFNTPLTLTVMYNHDDIPVHNEDRAQIFTWDEANLTWTGLVTKVDPVLNLVTASLLHFSRYVLVIPSEQWIYLPIVQK